MRQSRRVFLTSSVLCGLAVQATLSGVTPRVSAADWPQFLGPDRTGVSNETGLIDEWPADGPKELWRVEGGVGMSGVVVSGDTACTLIQTDGQQRVIALNVETGATKWSTPVATAYANGQGDGPRGTPAIVGGSVFVFTGDGTLARLKLSDGSIEWSHNVLKRHGGRVADYGMACSPLVVGDTVVVTAGATNGTVVACDSRIGEPRWTSGKGEAAGYSSPAVLTISGWTQIVAFKGASVSGIDLKSGDPLWSYPYSTDYDCNIATPVLVDGNVLISAGENHGSTMLKIGSKGDNFKVAKVWESTGGGSVMRTEWQTAIQLGDYLYAFDNVGSAGPVTHLVCIKAATGESVWRETRFGKGNMIAADGKLFASTMKGELVVIQANSDNYRELGRSRAIGRTRQAPSLSNGRLFLRDDNEIVCLDVRKK
ncbi:MAG: PQQ-binding-like beta-propeller repeat protein [Planctomycetota bacterium]|nr:PQQ-binding-like beta-propeller repeat protein [Planctomycetota bacterium]MDA1164337.1 PQQ-binding-like beta-propeller repeat protein [Planctomycetota bacterium]